MKKLFAKTVVPAAALSLLLSPVSAHASTTQAITLQTKHIYVNGNLSSSTYGFVKSKTTYMPIWYVAKALTELGISYTWKNGAWNLVIPSKYQVSLTNLSVPKPSAASPNSISLNGTVVARVAGVAHVDPASKVETMFMPIWYVQQALNRVGIKSDWNGTDWKLLPPATSTKTSTSVPPSTSTGSTTPPFQMPSVVQYGDTGQAVTIIQTELNSLGYNVGMADGQFGPRTLAEVKAFQADHGLTPTGIADTTTQTALSAATSGNASTVPPTGTTTRSPSGSFTNVDLRFPAPQDISATAIDNYLLDNSSPMTGLGASFMDSQAIYGVDANYLVSHSILESNWGKSAIAVAKNNLFGYGAYDSNPGSDAGLFPSEAYAILFQGWEVRNNYLEPGSSNYVSPTLTGMNANYASDTSWANSIGSLMGQFANYVGDNVSAYQTYTASQAAPQPASRTEPVYYLNGAVGVTQPNSNYSGVPYYPSMSDGVHNMFFAPIKNGSIGTSVAEVQQYLNQSINAGLTVDGQFGTSTEAAVKKFEGIHGLTQDGIWNFSMWSNYICPTPPSVLPVGQTVQIDQIEQGMAGGFVVPWYHIVNVGWVDAQYVKFTNVYRVNVANQTGTSTSIPVYSAADTTTQQVATLHNGDFIVAQTPTATNGFYNILFNVQMSEAGTLGPAGTAETGYVPAQTFTLTQQQ